MSLLNTLVQKEKLTRKQEEVRKELLARDARPTKSHAVKKSRGPAKVPIWHDTAVILKLEKFKSKAISEILDLPYDTVRTYLNSNAGKARAAELITGQDIDQIKRLLRDLGPLCIKAIKDLLLSTKEEHMVHKASKALDLLSLIGAKEAEKREHTHTVLFDELRSTIEKVSKRKEEEKTIVGTA